MLKKWFCFLLALLLPVTALADFTMAGYDPESLSRNWSTNLFFARMEERTGIAFTYQQFGDAAAWTRYKAGLTAGAENLPDLLFKAELTPAECITLLDKGVLVDLAPYLEGCCPNLWALLQEHPEWMAAITLPDGRIGALPFFSLQPMQNCLWINSAWLKKLNLTMPTNAEELTAVLRAFRDGDPNGNGRRDEIPLAFLGTFDLKFLAHAFGLTANDFNVYVQDGQVHFMPLESRYRDFAAWLHTLWSEGLLDPDGFSTSDTLRRVDDSSKTNVYGCAITSLISNFLPVDWVGDYAVVPPLVWNGSQVYRSFMGEVFTGTAAITTHCDQVETLLGWLDSFYTQEVAVLASTGQENTEYVFDGDGTWRLTPAASSNTSYASESLISTGGTIPGISTESFQNKYQSSSVQYLYEQLNIVNAVARRPFPYYSLTAAQEEEVMALQRRIAPLVEQTLALWVTGEEPLTDESFATFTAQLKEAGADSMTAFWQKILEEQTK